MHRLLASNVGIGTTIPANKLHLDVSVRDGIRLNATGTNGRAYELDVTDDGSVYSGGKFIIFDSLQGPRLTINSGGNVGIGTTVPGANLHINTAAGTNPTFAISDADVVNPFTSLAVTGSDVFDMNAISSTSGGRKIYSYTSGDFTAAVFAGLMGTADPADTTPALLLNGSKLNGTTAGVMGANETVLQIETGVPLTGTKLLTVLGSGNVGIGTTSPQTKLAVVGGNVGIGTLSAAGGNLIINGGGNVGIGSAWPGKTLDVQGTVRATAFMGDGSGLTGLSGTGWTTSGNDVYKTSNGNVGVGTTLTTTSALTVMNGNVGIGTWVARSALDINGTATIGKVVLTPTSAVQSITAAGGLAVVNNSYIKIVGSGGPVSINNGVTQIPAGTDGQELVLYGTDSTNTVQFHDGDGLKLNSGVSFTMGLDSTLRLIYNSTGGFWREVARVAS